MSLNNNNSNNNKLPSNDSLAEEAARLWHDADRLAVSDPFRANALRTKAERLLRLSQRY